MDQVLLVHVLAYGNHWYVTSKLDLLYLITPNAGCPIVVARLLVKFKRILFF